MRFSSFAGVFVPVGYLRGLTSAARTDTANGRIGLALAGTAGAAKAGRFLAIGQNTSHMSGMVSTLADSFIATVPLAAVPVADDLLRYPRRAR